MTAATITTADMIREAHAALHMAMELPTRAVLASAIIALADALGTYHDIDSDALCWEPAFPYLRDEADPDEAALRKAAEEVASAADALIAVLAAHCGTEDMKNVVAGVTA